MIIQLRDIEGYEYEITRIARIHYGNLFKKINGNNYKFNDSLTFDDPSRILPPDSDVSTVVKKKKISITPISLDLTGNLKNLKEFLKDY